MSEPLYIPRELDRDVRELIDYACLVLAELASTSEPEEKAYWIAQHGRERNLIASTGSPARYEGDSVVTDDHGEPWHFRFTEAGQAAIDHARHRFPSNLIPSRDTQEP